MKLTAGDDRRSSTAALRRDFAIFGRFRNPSGRIGDLTIDGDRLAKTMALLPAGASVDGLLAAAAEVMAETCPRGSQPIAIVGIGFASASAWWKGEFDESKHPRWPRGASESQGGRFRPRDDAGEGGEDDDQRAQLRARIKEHEDRAKIRTEVALALSVAAEAVANVVPGVGEAADVMMVTDIMASAAEFHRLRVDTEAAFAFVNHAPYSLDELRVFATNESFASYYEFTKVLLVKRFGPAAVGYQYHHIVEQGGANGRNIPPEQLHNTENIIRIPTLVHEVINAQYSEYDTELGTTKRNWLRTQPYEVQRAEGLKSLQELGILKRGSGRQIQ